MIRPDTISCARSVGWGSGRAELRPNRQCDRKAGPRSASLARQIPNPVNSVFPRMWDSSLLFCSCSGGLQVSDLVTNNINVPQHTRSRACVAEAPFVGGLF